MLQPDNQHDHLASLLCYLGALTLTGQTATGQWILEVPNLVMRKLYAERIIELTFPQPTDRDQAQAAAEALFDRGRRLSSYRSTSVARLAPRHPTYESLEGG